MSRYGLPYQGSKNAIAEKIVDLLPTAENFYDLFAGGCAITHRALIENRWKNYYANDINDIPQLFLDSISGKYKDEKRWISREDFMRLKDTDLYVSLCWSFGNNRKNYLYSKEVEPWKKALHYARVFGDCSLLKEMGIQSDGSQKDVRKHHEEYKQKYINYMRLKDSNISIMQLESLERLQNLNRLQSLERLQNLNRLQSLERLQNLNRLQSLNCLNRLRISQKSYDEIEIKSNSVIYCDIPYENTDTTGYLGNGFDHKKFFDWAAKQTEPVFISSYYITDDRFEEIAQMKKILRYNSNTNKLTTERLYTQKGKWTHYPETIFDLL